MTNFSRVKKNQILYEKIKSDAEAELSSDQLLSFPKRLSDNLNRKETPVNPANFAKRTKEEAETPVLAAETLDSDALIKSFIQEVKKYNIKSGLRTVEDTNLNILAELELDLPLTISPTEPVTTKVTPIDDTDEAINETKAHISNEIRKWLEPTTEVELSEVLELDEPTIPTAEIETVSEPAASDESLKAKQIFTTPEINDPIENVPVTQSSYLASLFLFIGALFFLVSLALFIYWMI